MIIKFINDGFLIFLCAIFAICIIPLKLEYIEKEDTEAVYQRTLPVIPTKHNELVDYWLNIYTKEYNIPRKIMDGVAYHETSWKLENDNYNAFRTSSANAYGALQVQLPTARGIWRDTDTVSVTKKKLLYDIKFNVETSCKLMRNIYDGVSRRYKSDRDRWLATLTIYNMGPGRFIKYNRRYNSYAKSIYNSYTEG